MFFLKNLKVSTAKIIAIIATNIPAFYESLFAIPALGAVINPINIRLDFEAIRFILEHGEAKAILVDTDFADVTKAAVEGLKNKPFIVDIADISAQNHEQIGGVSDRFSRDGRTFDEAQEGIAQVCGQEHVSGIQSQSFGAAASGAATHDTHTFFLALVPEWHPPS